MCYNHKTYEMNLTQQQVECNFTYTELPKIKESHGNNHAVIKEEWQNYLGELAKENKVPKHAINNWNFNSNN